MKQFAHWYRHVLPEATGPMAPSAASASPYSIFETDQARWLLIPTKRFDHLGEALSELIGRPVAIETTGISAQANVSAATLRGMIEERVVVGPLASANLCAQPIMRAAYSPSELAEMCRKWAKGTFIRRAWQDLKYVRRRSP